MGIRNGFRWRDKPPLGARLDRSSPHAAGLQCGWLLNEGTGPSAFDFSGNGRHAIFQSTASWGVGPNGLALACNGSNTGRADAAVGSILSGTNRGSIVAMASITASSAFQFVLTVDNALQNLFAFKTNGSNQQRLFVNGGPTATDPSAYDTLPHLWVGTYDGATGRLYRDGRLVASGAATGNFAAEGSPNTASLGGSVVVPGTPLTGLVSFGLVYDRALSDGEIRSLAANPWNMIEAPGTRRFFAPAGGGITPNTLTLSAAARSSVASLGIQNTPPATTLAVAAQAQSASVSIGLNAATTPSPLTISGLVAGWLPELISGSTDGGLLGSFADASGNGHDGSATGTQRSTYRATSINALPAVEVTADGQWFDLASPITLPDAYTLYFCASRTGDNLLRVLASAAGNGSIDLNGIFAEVVDDANTGGISGTFFGGAGAYLWRFRRAGAGQPHYFAASATVGQSIGVSGPVTLDTLLGKPGSSTATGDLFAGAVLYDRDLIGTADDSTVQQYFIDNRAVAAIPEANTLTVSAASGSASAVLGVQNTPPASTLAVSAVSSNASVGLNLQNDAPATNAVTVAAQAPNATASFGLSNVPPASTVTLSAQAQATLATLGLLSTPPASTLNVAAVSGDASVSLGVTVFIGVGLTVAAQAQSASASVGVSNVPPASTLTVAASSGPASASLAASVANPVTIAVAAVSGRSSASLGATVSGAALPITLTVDAAAADATVYLFARMVDPATLPSDRLAYAAIRDLLVATREFDAVLVGRQAATTPIPAKWSTYAVLTPTGNPQLKPDGTPSMLASAASYRLLIVARAATVRDDEQAYQRADRLKGLVLGTLLSAANRSYGGICSPWLSSLRPVGDPVKVEDEWRAELVGSFTYLINTLTGYSRSTARL